MSLPYNKEFIPRARELRNNMTPQENKLWYGVLRNSLLRFQRQKVLGQYIADFYCHKAKLVIEVDGKQHNTKDAREYDHMRTKVFESMGLRALRFTNQEIDGNLAQVRAKINQILRIPERAKEDIMPTIFQKPKGLTNAPLHYCPGCTHGIVHRLVAEALDSQGLTGRTIGVAPVGCAVFAYNYFNCDMIQAAHGRAPAVATGLKRANPESIVFTYQGDGDLAAIGTAETVQSAVRGENITIVFINNAIYGMTGGQMAPTTLPGQVTQTSPYGRDIAQAGMPIKVCEMLATLEMPAYIERVSVDCVKNVRAAGKAIAKAFRYQAEGKGFSFIEVVSNCPTNWGMSPEQSLEWIREHMLDYYRLGVYRDKFAEKVEVSA